MNHRGILFTTLALVSACSTSGCAGRVESPTGKPPLGVWQDSAGNLAFITEDTACGPSGLCETMIEVGPSFLLTEGGQYSWSYRDETLFVCLFPCATVLGSWAPTGKATGFSELTNSLGWAAWKRGTQ